MVVFEHFEHENIMENLRLKRSTRQILVFHKTYKGLHTIVYDMNPTRYMI